ncbi:hypothetical protein GMORB2_4344 [Geosmithia morbida]|uniref:Uncharacterized protein n=1 Tax=Geosmithia morbida TaxID=1094350 RepID=A0A9P4Z2M1_9HYPO|nr:uncharacterized protein GMORB2_4344 [Geosmithia morbida]KAF4125504.1 hypothetical protein GMORB2_4344 [Geosmithia morbida]
MSLSDDPTSDKPQAVIDQLDSRWLEMSAGTEGFLTGPRWTGLDCHQIAWGDMELAGHVNNVVYNRFAESSRINWFLKFADAVPVEHKQAWVDLLTPRGIGLILKSIRTDYKMPLIFPDQITVLHKLVEPPTSSSTDIFMEAVIISHAHQRPAARCFEDIVVYDYKRGGKANLPSFMVDELRAAFQLQEKTRNSILAEVAELQKSISGF